MGEAGLLSQPNLPDSSTTTILLFPSTWIEACLLKDGAPGQSRLRAQTLLSSSVVPAFPFVYPALYKKAIFSRLNSHYLIPLPFHQYCHPLPRWIETSFVRSQASRFTLFD